VTAATLDHVSTADASVAAEISAWVHHVAATQGLSPLSDRARLLLADGTVRGVVARDDTGRVNGWAQIDHLLDPPTVETAVLDRSELLPRLLDAAVTPSRAAPAGVRWWAVDAGEWSDTAAAHAGMVAARDLLQLRIELPVARRTDIVTRPFRIGHDEEAWLLVNNAAFDGHPEQGGWTLDDIVRREAEPWFDPEGFRLYEVDGELAAFCWTKVHSSQRSGGSPVGEIYVIAVHPRFHGQGLGRALTLAGLQWLAAQGITEGMLYVDAGNEAATALYHRLGFRTHHTDRMYRTPIAPQQGAGHP
jgi:mycothiol synthase